jgi:hypothetical protein
MGEWRQWRQQAQTAHPARYWMAETGLTLLQDTVNWPWDQFSSMRYYINNRWITRSHCLTASPDWIRPGQWRDLSDRFLPAMFSELVNFVEVECAWHNVVFDPEARRQVPLLRRWGWRVWRSPEAGLEYLRGMQQSDDAGPWTAACQEIMDLYHWWTVQRPARPNSMVESGWAAHCELARQRGYSLLDGDEPTTEQKQHTREIIDRMHQMEEDYDQEDERMMIRLIQVRNYLWT